MPYPVDLTTSDWVDHLMTLANREERVAALATFHRRIVADAHQQALTSLSDPDPLVNATVAAVVKKAIAAIPAATDYTKAG